MKPQYNYHQLDRLAELAFLHINKEDVTIAVESTHGLSIKDFVTVVECLERDIKGENPVNKVTDIIADKQPICPPHSFAIDVLSEDDYKYLLAKVLIKTR